MYTAFVRRNFLLLYSVLIFAQLSFSQWIALSNFPVYVGVGDQWLRALKSDDLFETNLVIPDDPRKLLKELEKSNFKFKTLVEDIDKAITTLLRSGYSQPKAIQLAKLSTLKSVLLYEESLKSFAAKYIEKHPLGDKHDSSSIVGDLFGSGKDAKGRNPKRIWFYYLIGHKDHRDNRLVAELKTLKTRQGSLRTKAFLDLIDLIGPDAASEFAIYEQGMTVKLQQYPSFFIDLLTWTKTQHNSGSSNPTEKALAYFHDFSIQKYPELSKFMDAYDERKLQVVINQFMETDSLYRIYDGSDEFAATSAKLKSLLSNESIVIEELTPMLREQYDLLRHYIDDLFTDLTLPVDEDSPPDKVLEISRKLRALADFPSLVRQDSRLEPYAENFYEEFEIPQVNEPRLLSQFNKFLAGCRRLGKLLVPGGSSGAH